jgi:hypothetical protein
MAFVHKERIKNVLYATDGMHLVCNRYTMQQIHNATDTQCNRYTMQQIHNATDTQCNRYTMQEIHNAGTHSLSHTNTQTLSHTHAHAHARTHTFICNRYQMSMKHI